MRDVSSERGRCGDSSRDAPDAGANPDVHREPRRGTHHAGLHLARNCATPDLGYELIRRAIATFQSQGYHGISLTVTAGNARAVTVTLRSLGIQDAERVQRLRVGFVVRIARYAGRLRSQTKRKPSSVKCSIHMLDMTRRRREQRGLSAGRDDVKVSAPSTSFMRGTEDAVYQIEKAIKKFLIAAPRPCSQPMILPGSLDFHARQFLQRGGNNASAEIPMPETSAPPMLFALAQTLASKLIVVPEIHDHRRRAVFIERRDGVRDAVRARFAWDCPRRSGSVRIFVETKRAARC